MVTCSSDNGKHKLGRGVFHVLKSFWGNKKYIKKIIWDFWFNLGRNFEYPRIPSVSYDIYIYIFVCLIWCWTYQSSWRSLELKALWTVYKCTSSPRLYPFLCLIFVCNGSDPQRSERRFSQLPPWNRSAICSARGLPNWWHKPLNRSDLLVALWQPQI